MKRAWPLIPLCFTAMLSQWNQLSAWSPRGLDTSLSTNSSIIDSVTLTYDLETSLKNANVEREDRAKVRDRVIKVIRSRLARATFKPTVEPRGETQFVVRLQNEDFDAAAKIQKLIERPGRMSIQIVAFDGDNGLSLQERIDAELARPNDDVARKEVAWSTRDPILTKGTVDYRWIPKSDREMNDRNPSGKIWELIAFRRGAGVDQGDVEDIIKIQDVSGNLALGLNFNEEGSKKLLDLTTKHIGRDLAVLVDDRVELTATIVSPFSECAQLSGGSMGYSEDEILFLQSLLHSEPLPYVPRLLSIDEHE